MTDYENLRLKALIATCPALRDASIPPAHEPDPRERDDILLGFHRRAPVALYRYDTGARPELIPARVDLFDYDGGYGWGSRGPAALALSYALAGKLAEPRRDEYRWVSPNEVIAQGRWLLEHVIQHLDGAQEHVLPVRQLLAVLSTLD